MRVQVCNAIAPIRDAWDRIAPRDRVVLESAHLEAIERARVNEIEPYYLLAYEADRLAGIAYCFLMQLDLASIEKDVPADAMSALRSWNADFMRSRILECGIVSGLGRAICAPAEHLSEVCRETARTMDRIAREAGAEFVLVRDIPHARLQDHASFLREGYAPLLGFPIARMAVKWASFDEYLAALKSHTRQDIRRALARRPDDVDVLVLRDFSRHSQRLAALWTETSRRAADYSHEQLTPRYFEEIQRCLPDRSHVLALERRGTLAAFALALVGDSEYFAVHCGVDYDCTQGDNLYDLLMLSLIQDAFSRGRRSLNWGITTYDYKFKRGFEPEPTVYLVKHVNPRLTLALARGLQKAIKQPENSHRPFRDLELASRVDLREIAARLPVTPPPPPSDLFSKAYSYDRTDNMKLAEIYSFCPPFESAQGPLVRYGGCEVVMLGSNAYLGLGTHPRLLAAAKAAIEKYGTGCSGSPLLNGTLDIHLELARALAEFMRKDDAILFSTGYQTNLGVVAALLAKGDVVVMDQYNHASLLDGARLAGAEIARFRHNDMKSLERVLRASGDRGKLVAVDSVFSMEGTVADLRTIVQLARSYGAKTMLDEAHAIGVLGPGGRGAAELQDVLDQVDIVMGTFSKSFASVGGFVAAEAKVIDYLRHVARSHVFSASLPPASVAAVRAALEIIKDEPDRRRRVLHNAAYMSSRLRALGYDAPFGGTAIVPVSCGSDELTLGAYKRLLDKGVFVNPALYPAVPKGASVLRTSYMATHTEPMLDRALEVFAAIRTPSFPARASARRRSAGKPARLRVRPLVLLPLADRLSLTNYYVAGSRRPSLRVPGFTRLAIGEAVDCGISFGREGIIVQSEALVVDKWQRLPSGRALGVELELLPGKAESCALIDRIVSGDPVLPAGRRCWRYHADLEVEHPGDGVEPCVLADISADGAAIRGGWEVARGSRVDLRLRPPDSTPIDVAAEVRWQRRGDDPGFGVRFQFAGPAERDRVWNLVRTIGSAFAEAETASAAATVH